MFIPSSSYSFMYSITNATYHKWVTLVCDSSSALSATADYSLHTLTFQVLLRFLCIDTRLVPFVTWWFRMTCVWGVKILKSGLFTPYDRCVHLQCRQTYPKHPCISNVSLCQMVLRYMSHLSNIPKLHTWSNTTRKLLYKTFSMRWKNKCTFLLCAIRVCLGAGFNKHRLKSSAHLSN